MRIAGVLIIAWIIGMFISALSGFMPTFARSTDRCWDPVTAREWLTVRSLFWSQSIWSGPNPGVPLSTYARLPRCDVRLREAAASRIQYQGIPFRSMYWYQPEVGIGVPLEDASIKKGLPLTKQPITNLYDPNFIVPYGIIWRNSLLNAFVFAAASIALWRLLLSAKGRWLRRRNPSACIKCGYDLSGILTDVCPECGAIEQKGHGNTSLQ